MIIILNQFINIFYIYSSFIKFVYLLVFVSNYLDTIHILKIDSVGLY